MPKDLLYASFKDAPYTSQFVGSTHNELKDAQQVLNQTYDISKESDSKLGAVARDMAQKAHPKDSAAAQQLFEHVKEKLDTRSKSGRYEDMLHETTNDARQFNVNTSKILENKKRIDEAYKKLMDDPNKSEAAKKSIWDNLIMRGQDSLGYDKNQGLVTGEGFKDKDIANDYSFSNEAFNVGKLVKDDIISGKYAATKNGAYGWYKPVTDKQGNTTYTQSTDAGDPNGKVFKRTSEGKLEEVSTQEINDTLTNYWKSNRAAQGYISREVDRNSIPTLDAIDNSNLSPQEKQLAKQRIKDQTYQQLHQNEIAPAIEAAKVALGYRKQSVGTDYAFDANLDKSLNGSGKDSKGLTPNELQTLEGIQENNPYYKENKYNFSEGSYDNPEYLSKIKYKFKVPGEGEMSATELQKKFDDFQSNPENKNKYNPYAIPQRSISRAAAMENVSKKIEDPIKSIQSVYDKDPMVKGVVDHLNIDLKNYSESSIKDKQKIADQIQKALNSKSEILRTRGNSVKLFDPTLQKQVSDYLKGSDYYASMSYADPKTGERMPLSELIKKELDIDVNDIDDLSNPDKVKKLEMLIKPQGFSEPDGSNSLYKTKVGTKTVNIFGSSDQQQEFDEINKIARIVSNGVNTPIPVNFTQNINGFNLKGVVIPQDHWNEKDPTKYEKRDAVVVLDENTYIPNVGLYPKGTAFSYSSLLDLQRAASRTLNPTRRNKEAKNSDLYQDPKTTQETSETTPETTFDLP